jgi:hypothetical protein
MGKTANDVQKTTGKAVESLLNTRIAIYDTRCGKRQPNTLRN